jgi:predicted RNase H-like HicB family nuclease
MKYTAIIEELEGGGYFAQCAEIENAFTQGKTLEELMENFEDVIKLVLECQKIERIKETKKRGVNFFKRIAVL